jgi:hypothetical protein
MGRDGFEAAVFGVPTLGSVGRNDETIGGPHFMGRTIATIGLIGVAIASIACAPTLPPTPTPTVVTAAAPAAAPAAPARTTTDGTI